MDDVSREGLGDGTAETVFEDSHASMGTEDLLRGLAFALQECAEGAPAALPLAPLVGEVEVWLTSARDESWRRSDNRESLKQEVLASQKSVAPALGAHLGADLTTYVADILAALARTDRAVAEKARLVTATNTLRTRLAQPAALAASWVDLGSAVKALDFFAAAATVMQLEAQLNLTHRDGKHVLDEVRNILRRDSWTVEFARQRLGDVPQRPPIEFDKDEPLDIAPAEVLDLASRSLVEPGKDGHAVVWGMYDRAAVEGTAEVGPITAYFAPWVIARAFDTEEQSPLLAEVRNLWHARRDHESNEDLRGHVLVRVDLGVRTPVGALDDGIDLVEALMDAVLSLGSNNRWGKPKWWTLLVDGEEMRSILSRGSKRPEFEDSLGMENAARVLARESQTLGRAFLHPLPWHLREALRSCAEASHAESRAVSLYREWHNDERTVLLLLDAALEHMAALGDTSANQLVERIAELWPSSGRTRLILWAIDLCLHRRDGLSRPSDAAKDLKRRIVANRDGLTETSLLRAYYLLNDLIGVCSSPLQAAVVRRLIGQLGDLTVYEHEESRLQDEARLTRTRQRRVRNALTHGNPVTRPVLVSVLPFTRFRTVMAIRAGLDSINEGVTFLDYLDAKAAERMEDASLKAQGQSLISIWESREP
ncbi:hypothetical protein [Blastococcus sp. LR1]|uniref:hypothetical protein n=1 Tax=Blastococcus sp. LR1 TaxID=2877000 RepID=UPI001CCE6224|nr:hypothetical protein [Blastococcus sp. LR1]MCA0146656.1 hypothetical protein [Blastococcus sp. LR1]